MNENRFDFLSDNELSEMLSPFPPPDSVTKAVSPWRKATRQMLIGFALMAVVPQIFPLNLICPLAGSISMFLGFRSLRKENSWFFFGFILSCVILGSEAVSIFLNSSVVRYTSQSSAPFSVMSLSSLLLIFLTSVSISAGIITVKKRLGYTSSALSPFAFVGIMTLIIFLALINFTGALTFFVLIAYVLVFVFLIKLSKELDGIGYSIKIAGAVNSDKTVVTICLGLAFLISLTGYVFFSRYPMEWQPQVKNESAQIEEIKTKLLSLGFPEDVLSDLKDEDILQCENAVYVDSRSGYQAFNNGRKVRETRDNTTYIHTEYDEKEVLFTTINVLINEDENEWKLFHHFKWVIDKGYFGAEAISVEPSTSHSAPKEPSGQVLYDFEGKTYSSPFMSEGDQTYKSTSPFNPGKTMKMYFAEFSYPLKGKNKRGYVTYRSTFFDESVSANSILCYAHNKTPLQYPVKSATHVLKNVMQDSFAFVRRYDYGVIDTGDYYLNNP